MSFWPMYHFAYKIGKLIHRQSGTNHKLPFAYGTKCLFVIWAKNFCRQNTTFSWKPCVHFAYGLLAYMSFCLENRQIYTSRSGLFQANFLIREFSYLIHEANYLTHEDIYLIHEANYLIHEANAIIFST
jgi:hypothetical protein